MAGKKRTEGVNGFILRYCGDAASPAAAVIKDANGLPTRQYSKDLIRVGKYVKSDGDGGLTDMTVTADMLDNWAEQFSAMKKAGVKVPMPVDHTSDPEANRGYVLDMWVEGDTLMGRVELIGEDGIALASRTEVSIYAPPEVVAGNARYPRAIEHVAIVTNPVVADQGGFVPIKLSRGGTTVKVPVLRMCQENPDMEFINELGQALGIDGAVSMSQDDLKPKVLERVKAIMASKSAGDKAVTDLAAARGKIAELEKAAGKSPEAPHPQVVKLARENRTMKLGELVKAGRITPAVRDRLAATFCPDDAQAFGRTLDAENDAQFDAVVKALGENDPKVLGEQTKAQSHVLSRTAPGSEGDFDAKANEDYMASRLKGLQPAGTK